MERVNKEIGRRLTSSGYTPNDQALVRLAGMLLLGQNDEWLVQRRYLSDNTSDNSSRCQTVPEQDRSKNHTRVIELNAA